MQTARETSITERIVAAIKKRYPGAQVRKRHGTVMGVAGDPDLYGCIRGRHFEIEVKRPGEEPTKIQAKRIADWNAAGAITAWVTSAEDAITFLHLNLPRWAHPVFPDEVTTLRK